MATSATATPEARPREAFSIERALNDKEFAKFLGTSPDGEQLVRDKDLDTLEKRWGAFKTYRATAKEVKGLYIDQISRDTGGQVKLKESELQMIDDHLRELVLTDPEEVQALLEDAKFSKEGARRVSTKEAEVTRMSGETRTKLAEKKTAIEAARGAHRSLFKWRLSAAEKTAAEKAQREYGVGADSDSVDQAIAQVDKELNELDTLKTDTETEVEDIKTRLDGLRSKFFEYFDPAIEVNKLAQTKAQEKLRDLLDPAKGLASLEKGQDLLKKLREGGETGMLIYMEGLDEDAMQKQLDADMEARIVSEMEAAVSRVSTPTLDGVKRSLQDFMRRADSGFGSKTPDEAKDFIRDAIEGVIKTEPDLAKRLILVHLATTLESRS